MTVAGPPRLTRTVTLPGGATMEVTVDDDGVLAKVPRIKSVGIVNLATVRSHFISDALGSVSHVVQFAGGGELRFAYSLSGELLELQCDQLQLRIKCDVEVLVEPFSRPTAVS